MIDLKAQYGSIYRITLDESAKIDGQTREERLWLYQIPCKYGHIYVHGKERLGAYARGRLITGRLLAIPGVTLHQRGDREVSATFDPELLEQVAELLHARKRPVISDERRAELAAKTKQWSEERRQRLGKNEAPAP